ncbi:uncharacterized protein VTP21DRAFT_4302 [Calcarisporiella thermophila]|uniref:uncharacterized protein n=1 Tax=Calcarisporiella thermophila TaxID=911321 RepID=UPI0037432D95
MEQWNQYQKGDRVEYLDRTRQKQTGTIQEIQGSGQNLRFTVLNDQTQKQEECSHQNVERKLQLGTKN